MSHHGHVEFRSAVGGNLGNVPPELRSASKNPSNVLTLVKMATKKDMRRADLVVPYVDPASKKKDGDMASALSSTLPMAAMFTRSRCVPFPYPRAETSVVFSLQNWMAESPEQKKNSSTPGYLSVIMSVMAVIVVCVLSRFHSPYCVHAAPNHLSWQMDDFQQANAISQDLRSLIPTSSSGKTGQGGSHVLSHPSSIVQIQCFNNENVNNVGFDEFYLDLGARAIIPTLYI
ncbi:hypothetical protein CIRG_00403 [Coccidioides immitis RMSCC 2394]|uniref:Uncharacterized protein n=1 Tax=Coccidioides immitis RMSCC 2394 TaxID=404692 RepID=A0A0J6XVP7_COCIT|nr:hypothetical protein CIRG_00403 [Coccidioides immitis RMSCC 2394]